jgi:hypothetical protein
MLCLALFSLFVSLIYNTVSPTGIKLIRHKQKEAQKSYLDTGSRTILKNPAKITITAL